MSQGNSFLQYLALAAGDTPKLIAAVEASQAAVTAFKSVKNPKPSDDWALAKTVIDSFIPIADDVYAVIKPAPAS